MPENQKQLRSALIERIRQKGPMPVAEYMSLAVDAYYKSQMPFGTEGDFTTAPEISQMFGEMVGAWLVDVWMQMGRPEDVKLVELGPGRGVLAADVMRTISNWPEFRSAVTLHLVETSPALRELQAVALKDCPAKWYDKFSEVPEGVCLAIANEFFDALPVHQFQKVDRQWHERCVGYDEGRDSFYFTHSKYPHPLHGYSPSSLPEGEGIHTLIPSPLGCEVTTRSLAWHGEGTSSIFETSPVSQDIIKEISERIARCGGAALIIDYGHLEPGLGDTLQAVSKHKFSDPLENPGAYDITAHVDFGTLKLVAEQAVTVSGPITQGQFLIALGIEARAQKLGESANDRQRNDIMTALCRLVAPQEMGRLFKVMALTPKAATIVPAGFGEHLNETSDD